MTDPKPDDLATDILPDCMLPDGTEPCAGFRQEHERVERLTKELAENRKLLVPNPCSVCGTPITGRDGKFIGTGDGSMRDGGSFAHAECYHRQRAEAAERARDDAVADRDRLRAMCMQMREALDDLDCYSSDPKGYAGSPCETKVRNALALPLPVAPVSEG